MLTLQDLKDKIEELETSLPDNQKLSDIPLQYNRNDDYNDIDIELYNKVTKFIFVFILVYFCYLGFIYATIVIS